MTTRLLRLAIVLLAPRRDAPAGRLRSAALRAALGLLIRRVHLRELLALLAPDPSTPPGTDAGPPLDLGGLRRSRVTCLHRALAAYAMLRPRGEPVRLLIGVAHGSAELLAHAWLERDGVPLDEPDDPRARYAVVFTHPSGAEPLAEELPMAAIRANPDVLFTELNDGTGVLLHLGTKFYFALNRSGVAAWKLLASGAVDDPEALARALSERFAGAALERVRADVEALLAELTAESLVLQEPAAP